MRQKKSFKEWALRVFASIMKTVAPTMAVKSFTIWFKEGRSWYKDDAKDRAKLFLPGAAKEIKAIKKLQLTETQMQRRVWSPETELELLKQGNYALIGNIKSDNTAALDIICATDEPQLIAKVFSQATPSVAYLKSWIKTAKECVVIAVMKQAPAVFNDLHFEDIENLQYLGALVNCALEPDSSKQVKNSAKKWAEEVATRDEYMSSFLDNKPEQIELFGSAMEVLIKADYNFTRYLPTLERYHKKWYGAVRDHADFSAYIEDYLIERLPKVWFMAETKGVRAFDRRYGGELTDKQDAASWMVLTRKFIDKPRVAIAALQICTYLTYGNPDKVVVDLQKALVSGISTFHVAELALSKLPEQYRWQLQAKLYEGICTADEAKKALKLLPKSYRKGVRAKFAEVAKERDANLLLSYWPYAGWEEKSAESVIRKLAEFKRLPLNKLEELPENLQKAGVEELEILSEIKAITRISYGDAQKELMKQKFHARAEMQLFGMDYNWQELKKLYISSNEMDERAFRSLTYNHGTGYSGDEGRIAELIRLHAKTWGLTETEYKDLMQSPYYSELAADLKKHCKGTEAEVATTEEPANDEKSEA